MIRIKGDRIQPCLTPDLIRNQLLTSFLILTTAVLFSYIALITLTYLSGIPYEVTRTLEESINTEDLGFAIELRQSARVKTGTLGRHSLESSSGALVKPPPRPASASIAYSDDESAKAYDDNDDGSSVTERPSLSSSESQSSESEEESVRSNPHSFVNHYANVNDTLRQSWKRQRPVRNYSSYTDSEEEGSAVMSLNGGQIVMNNLARSRAPVSGFSSFV
ncbi:protein sidekick-like [Artemia franciscana]|uniref:protein sidekick-like n=1 Tax=Artemia franciscana TaxID=6661 RepID=UPI0032DA0A39